MTKPEISKWKNRNKTPITQDLLKNLIHYSPETGVFTWKPRERHFFQTDTSFRAWNGTFPGKVAGKHVEGEYEKIMVLGIRHASHRLAFLYVHGYLPRIVDHINGDIKDNRISNLRAATPSQNGHNKSLASNNKSGFKGVSWSNVHKRWEAYITLNYKRTRLGFFNEIEDAVSALEAARKVMVGEFAKNQQRP